MSSRKVQCSSCASYRDCSNKTRAFVNYCGSFNQEYSDNIREAINDCLLKKGMLFKRVSIISDFIPTSAVAA